MTVRLTAKDFKRSYRSTISPSCSVIKLDPNIYTDANDNWDPAYGTNYFQSFRVNNTYNVYYAFNYNLQDTWADGYISYWVKQRTTTNNGIGSCLFGRSQSTAGGSLDPTANSYIFMRDFDSFGNERYRVIRGPLSDPIASGTTLWTFTRSAVLSWYNFKLEIISAGSDVNINVFENTVLPTQQTDPESNFETWSLLDSANMPIVDLSTSGAISSPGMWGFGTLSAPLASTNVKIVSIDMVKLEKY